jgi:hypothetical protein
MSLQIRVMGWGKRKLEFRKDGSDQGMVCRQIGLLRVGLYSPERHIEVLMPRTCKRDLICRCNQVKFIRPGSSSTALGVLIRREDGYVNTQTYKDSAM